MSFAREGTESLTDAYLAKPLHPAICQVDQIYPHKSKWIYTRGGSGGGDYNFNVVKVHLRDVTDSVDDEKKLKVYDRALVLQRDHGNATGHPWTPKVGDLVLVIYLHANVPIIIGTLPNVYQQPVCRPSSTIDDIYDIVYKITKWNPPTRSEDTEFNWVDHPFPQKNPICFKYFDKKRDLSFVHSCPYGYKGHDEVCEECRTIDRIDGGTYLKFFSDETESETDPAWRTKFHHHCGSLAIFDEDGTILIKNKVDEDPRGHIKFYPSGKIEAHSEENEEEGSQAIVYPDGEEIACEMRHNPTGAYVRIYQDGSVTIKASNVTIDSENVLMTGSCIIEGSLTHGNGPCCNFGEGWME